MPRTLNPFNNLKTQLITEGFKLAYEKTYSENWKTQNC